MSSKKDTLLPVWLSSLRLDGQVLKPNSGKGQPSSNSKPELLPCKAGPDQERGQDTPRKPQGCCRARMAVGVIILR